MTEDYISNKKLSKKVQAYLIKQDIEIVARLCASLMLDIARYDALDELSREEQVNLAFRTRHNASELRSFAIENNPKPLTITNIDHDEAV